VGLFGKTGAYSFDFFKIATCGEGGVMVTQDAQAYHHAECYSDHGHDHIGNNRGMENHPVMGFNYRIGELNAAIGLAQTRKVPFIREKNRQYKKQLTQALSGIPGLSFSIPGDPEGDSATFLNIFLPDAATAQQTVAELNKAGVGGFNYWFLNMYHFINQWTHLKDMKTAAPLAIQVLGAPQDYQNLHLPKSQEVVGRLISFVIKVTWTEAEVAKLAEQIKSCVQKALTPVHA
ncbi:MAG: DegT/DnrJ/EryC1/StrS family aminotransferase, partial [Cyclobacteriaceae bacterium]|nr:DegT/DnrJ/EryC1/StrS family aminotransferase [Cyclobacteriaceae bacterium]